MRIPLLEADDLHFPNPRSAIKQYDGLLCVSHDITPQRLLAAYRHGIFPWYSDEEFIYWFAVSPRAVLLPDHLHISRSLAKTLRNKRYRVTVNHDFEAVIQSCAQIQRLGQDGSWIEPKFIQAYTQLHHLGYAHSFECYMPDESGKEILTGGLYGVQIGKVFFGESMFAKKNDASKIAFACAVPYLAQHGIELIDCQQDTAHLAHFGSQTLPFDDFEIQLKQLTPQSLTHELMSTEVYSNWH